MVSSIISLHARFAFSGEKNGICISGVPMTRVCPGEPTKCLGFSGFIVRPAAATPIASGNNLTWPFFKPLHCSLQVDGGGIMCEPCIGKGWLLCDFCKGQKTNVKADNNRIYRRCPSCRAIGYVLCSKCKVFKCVTFPNGSDGEELTF
ncbi:uncharacterized protein LOC120210900 isoform X2 [Hibiscus syriacus]|uniref:uncharacterized protein LOC120210900 isoform X2 n=1 Tax=Hibiscus syriacus TaxID=106335 RepID=UPI0019247B19|nr:uncharacterized protein LOC120210900 isoform X2 [Hibiscus syriacus]